MHEAAPRPRRRGPTLGVYRVSDGRLATAVAVSLAAHAIALFVLSSVDLPRQTPSGTMPPIHVTLTGFSDRSQPAAVPEPVPVPFVTPTPPQPTASPTVVQDPQHPAEATPLRPFAGRSAAALARDVAALAEPEPHAGKSRVHQLYASAGTTPEFAYYLDAWRRKVIRIGNVNYPREARTRALSGSLRLLVAITADGDLRDVRVLETSGHRVLDEAAVRIVRLAAPYAPFSPRMRATTDLLRIERTWHFRNNRYSS